MTQDLTAAQQAQIDNRDATGRFTTKTHTDVDDSADVLGVAHERIGALSEGQQRTLEKFNAERVVWHSDQSQALRDSIEEMGEGLANTRPGDVDAYVDNIDGVNHHEVAALAHLLPIDATYAEVHSERPSGSAPRVTAWFDRNGSRHETDVLLPLEQPDSVELPFWAGSVTGPVGATSSVASTRNHIDLEAAREWSDNWTENEAGDLRDSGQEEENLPNEATGEITGMRRRATLREFDPVYDDPEDGDHIEVCVDGEEMNSGTATTELPQTYPGKLADGDIAFVQDDRIPHPLGEGDGQSRNGGLHRRPASLKHPRIGSRKTRLPNPRSCWTLCMCSGRPPAVWKPNRDPNIKGATRFRLGR